MDAIKNVALQLEEPLDLASKFEAVRNGTLANFATAIPEDLMRADTFPARGYFHEIDSAIGAPWMPSKSSLVTNFVGAYSYMNSGGYLRENVLIGRYVSIGRRVTIAAGGHALHGLSTSPSVRGTQSRSYGPGEAERVRRAKASEPFTVIESDVWIGDGVVILPGVHLAVGSVVGANAVVVRNTAPYEIIGGVPARPIGRRFDEQTARTLIDTKWWEYDRETINRFPCANIFEFLERFTAAPPPRSVFATFLRP